VNVDKDVIRRKLIRLADHIGRLEDKKPKPLDRVLTDRDCQDIISHNLVQAIQICVDISSHVCAAHGRAIETAGQSFLALAELNLIDERLARNLVSAVGFRNVSVHQYHEVDWTVVMRIVDTELEHFKEFGAWASALVEAPPPPE
jgi:uncharacterized protein YutE (UPF0331/DUF86 family)